MKIQDKITILRYLFNLLNGVFLLLGLILLGCGLWILYDQNNFFTALVSTDAEDSLTIGVAYALLGVGAAVSTISLLGFLGSLREVRCLLILYMSLLILICVAQIAVQLVLFTQQGEILKILNEKFEEVITHYGNRSFLHQEHEWELLNAIQKSLRCCGNYNASDWKKNQIKDPDQLPCSCLNSTREGWFCETTDYGVHPKGCGSEIGKWFFSNIIVINGIGLCTIVIQIFEFTLAVTLFRSFGEKAKVVQDT